MATYTLNVHVDALQLEALKTDGYKMCVAKKVNDTYTVVWQSKDDFLQENTFEWTEEFQVFGTNKFTIGALVKAATNAENISYGETCLLDAAGKMSSATGTPDNSGKFQVTNKYGQICLGVSAKLGDQFLPVFVSPTPIVGGVAHFQPKVAIKVWFSTDLETSTMIFDSNSEDIEVVYSGTTTMNIAYAGAKAGLGAWSLQ